MTRFGCTARLTRRDHLVERGPRDREARDELARARIRQTAVRWRGGESGRLVVGCICNLTRIAHRRDSIS